MRNWIEDNIKVIYSTVMLLMASAALVFATVPNPPTGGRAWRRDQMVRVYGPTGVLLATGHVKNEEWPVVTICEIRPVGMGGKFFPTQCMALDRRGQFLVVDAHEAGVTYAQP